MIITTGTYYLVYPNVLKEDEYIQNLRDYYNEGLEEATRRGTPKEDIVTFEEFLKKPDNTVDCILEIDMDDLKKCDCLDDIDDYILNKLCKGLVEKSDRYEDYETAIKEGRYSYFLNGQLIGIQFDVLERNIDYDNLGETFIRCNYIYIIDCPEEERYK